MCENCKVWIDPNSTDRIHTWYDGMRWVVYLEHEKGPSIDLRFHQTMDEALKDWNERIAARSNLLEVD